MGPCMSASPLTLALVGAGAAVPSALLGRFSATVAEAVCCVADDDTFSREVVQTGLRKVERLIEDFARRAAQKEVRAAPCDCEVQGSLEAWQVGLVHCALGLLVQLFLCLLSHCRHVRQSTHSSEVPGRIRERRRGGGILE